MGAAEPPYLCTDPIVFIPICDNPDTTCVCVYVCVLWVDCILVVLVIICGCDYSDTTCVYDVHARLMSGLHQGSVICDCDTTDTIFVCVCESGLHLCGARRHLQMRHLGHHLCV